MSLVTRHPSPRTAGVALIVTVILISVIAFMTITFLVLSDRERGAVATATDQTVARLAAEAGMERAQAEALAPILATTNALNFDLLVATNFINWNGFDPAAVDHRTNVNFEYQAGGGALTADDALQNLANLLYSPRPPVFVTNRLFANSNEFRFYLDLNRNGRYDTNGFWPVIGPGGGFLHPDGTEDSNPANSITNFFVGDPEWIGQLARPDQPHSATNLFVSRYTYAVIPAGKTLDVNYIHNLAASKTIDPVNDGYLRNQGVGSWEINLAAFFSDLNTNAWIGYQYQQPGFANVGTAFDDARAILSHRYANSYASLRSVTASLLPNGPTAFRSDTIDGYSDGPLMLGVNNVDESIPANQDNPDDPWPGSDNPNHFFTTQDFFDPNKTSSNFTNRLAFGGTATNSYDRYTYYRMLAQLGTDSAPEDPDKLNLNYKNTGGVAATNFVSWTPEDFFTNAADRMIRRFTENWLASDPNGFLDTFSTNRAFTLTNIPVWVNSNLVYQSSVHRLLQVAANIYDATTNRAVTAYPYLPSVFRPIFRRDPAGNVFIAGYVEETNDRLVASAPPMIDVTDATDRNSIRLLGTPIDSADPTEPMVYGVPIVIGAKKGLPNFNEFSMQTLMEVTRKLEFRRDPTTGRVNETNQMYIVGVSNVFGVEAWNSYSNTFPRVLRMTVAMEMTMVLTNESGVVVRSNRTPTFFSTLSVPVNTWDGFTNTVEQLGKTNSFRVPLASGSNNIVFLPTSIWRPHQAGPAQFETLTGSFERNAGYPVPRWWLNLNTRLRFILVDISITPNRIVDYVNLDRWENTLDVTAKMMEGSDCATLAPGSQNIRGNQWCTNRLNGSSSETVPTYGIMNQIVAGREGSTEWKNFKFDPQGWSDVNSAVDGFRFNLWGLSPKYPENVGKTFYKSNIFYAPLAPYRPIYVHTSWQANDPLVHYTIGDLLNMEQPNNVDFDSENPSLPNLGHLNNRFEPWGGNPGGRSSSTTPPYELAVKDPMVRSSEGWIFPTNKLPTIGWLGRVHRGTPWQTVYLKSAGVNSRKWQKWTGNPSAYDAAYTQPANDRLIFDLFTAAFSDNAVRGQLSINVGSATGTNSSLPNVNGLAAWSAVLGGMVVLSNSVPDAEINNGQSFTPVVIEPAGIYDPTNPNNWPAVAKIVEGINRERARTYTNSSDKVVRYVHGNAPVQPGSLGYFTRLGDILSVPELSTNSPFLNLSSTAQLQRGLNDAVYEWLPQQMLSLVRLGEPRFVVYAYGQTLKPAPRSIITSGPFFGMCTNYQIMAEVAMRAVVRLEGAPTNSHAVIESYNVLPPD